jgi:lysophospholipase L1-like esterase
MKNSYFPCALFLLGIWSFAAFPAHAQQGTAPQGAFFFRDGDRAQIFGDSITEQQTYSTLMESFVLSRFPTWKITFRNTGWEGDKMGLGLRGGQDKGIARDIAPLQPTAITVNLGMNDVQGGPKGVDIYLQNARTLTDKLKALTPRVALLTPSSKESNVPDVPGGATDNIALRIYADGLKGVAAEKGVLFVEELAPFINTIEAGRKAGVLKGDKSSNQRLTKEGTHPTWDGGLVMALAILKGLNAPSLVSSVELDAKTGVARTEKAKVTEVKTGATLSFTRLDDALPWPIGQASLALKIPGFTPLDDLSRYELKVANLAAPKYDVLLDGKKVATYTAAQLAAGANLSLISSGSIAEQQDALLKAILEKNATFKVRWRQVQVYEPPAWAKDALEPARKAELKRLDDLIPVLETKINALRLPKPHTWTLQPAA